MGQPAGVGTRRRAVQQVGLDVDAVQPDGDGIRGIGQFDLTRSPRRRRDSYF